MKAPSPFPLLWMAACLWPVSLCAQVSGGLAAPDSIPDPASIANNITPLQKGWAVEGKVTTLQGDPIPRAKVLVQPNVAAEFRSLETDMYGKFRTDYWLNVSVVQEFSATLTVTKKGYRKAQVLADFGSADQTWIVPVTLRETSEDPDLLSQAELVFALAPRLKTAGTLEGLAEREQKDYARAVNEYLDRKRPDRAVPGLLKVARRDPTCLKCRTLLALAELDAGDWDGAYREVVEASKSTLADPTHGRPEPLTIVGVMQSWRNEPQKAASFFLQALNFSSQDPLALQELGRSQLLLQNWGAADAYLLRALNAGAGPEARLLRVAALLGEGHTDEANQEMTRYLDGRDVRQMPLRVRRRWAQTQDQKKVTATYAKAKAGGHQPVDDLHQTPPELQGLEPAEDQTPLEAILKAVGKNVEESFRNFPNTSSLEQIHQEKLRSNGKVKETQDQKFRYLCLTPAESWGPSFTEFRTDLSGNESRPQGVREGYMLTSGFASAALVFHPLYQAQSTFRYRGRQQLDGREILVVAFAQQPAKARLYGMFKSGKISMFTFTQGLAWIDPETYQILRLHTDLLAPLIDVDLEKQATEIEFSAVHFNRVAQAVWLPRDVTVTVAWSGKELRNTHLYSDFKLFNVDSTQKLGKPKGVPADSAAAPESQTPR